MDIDHSQHVPLVRLKREVNGVGLGLLGTFRHRLQDEGIPDKVGGVAELRPASTKPVCTNTTQRLLHTGSDVYVQWKSRVLQIVHCDRVKVSNTLYK